MYLHLLPSNKKNVPLMIPDPIGVVKDIRAIVLQHKDDCPDQAITAKYVLRWSENDDEVNRRGTKKMSIGGKDGSSSSSRRVGAKGGAKKVGTAHAAAAAGANRRRRVRCKMCEACLGEDCQQCVYCKDMNKYGGPGRMKQTCEKVKQIYLINYDLEYV